MLFYIMVPVLYASHQLGLHKRDDAYENTTAFTVIQMTCQVLFTADLFLSFFKVPLNIVDEPTLKLTSKAYLKGWFLFDFVATIPGLIVYFMPNGRSWYYLLNYLRIIRLRKFTTAYALLVKYHLPINTTKHMIRKYESVFAIILYYIMFVHWATCFWISMGAHDIDKDPKERESWLFITEVDFTNDKRSIFD